jgi:hypothetical protein
MTSPGNPHHSHTNNVSTKGVNDTTREAPSQPTALTQTPSHPNPANGDNTAPPQEERWPTEGLETPWREELNHASARENDADQRRGWKSRERYSNHATTGKNDAEDNADHNQRRGWKLRDEESRPITGWEPQRDSARRLGKCTRTRRGAEASGLCFLIFSVFLFPSFVLFLNYLACTQTHGGGLILPWGE